MNYAAVGKKEDLETSPAITLRLGRSARGRLRGQVDTNGMLDRSPGCMNPPLDTTLPQAEQEC
jgi:hypothetical protein